MSRRARLTRRTALLVLLVCGALCPAAAAAIPAWTTYHRDGLRSGFDPDSSSPLPPTELWQSAPALDGDIYAEPLIYGSRVYVATENDSVYALDAGTGRVIWRRNVGRPVPDHSTSGCGDIGNVGITSTPVIDPATGRIYAVADMWDGSHIASIRHELVGMDLSNGSPAPGLPINVDGPGSMPRYQLQRTGLALDRGRIVIGFGGNSGDCGDYNGWLVSAPESGGGPLERFEVDASGSQGAIWGGGNAPAVDALGDIWISTGNGNSSSYDYQEAVLKFSPSLSLLGHWVPTTPHGWQYLDNNDVDIGSSEPLPLPGGMFFQIGKEGIGYLLSSTPTELFQHNVCPGEAFGGGTYYAGVIYVSCADGLEALALNTAAHSFSLLSSWQVPSDAIGPPIIAANLVWSTGWNNGTLYALDRSSGAARFSPDLGEFDHFATPSAAGGRLFVANANRVTAFTIAKGPVAPPPPVAPRINSVSLRGHVLSLTLSEPGSLRVVISLRLSGRRVHGRCRAGARTGARCRYEIRKSTQSFTAVQGSNRFTLRWHGPPAGHYVAAIVARSLAGLSSRRHTIAFTLKRR
jgi:outer membrane protein assembly factor BamB